MATIYSAPKEIKVPEFNWKDLEQYRKDQEQYLTEMKTFIKTKLSHLEKVEANKEFVGESILIPHADGHAHYMVVSVKPPIMVHIPLGDCWDSPHAGLYTSKAIKDSINSRRKMDQLFKKK